MGMIIETLIELAVGKDAELSGLDQVDFSQE